MELPDMPTGAMPATHAVINGQLLAGRYRVGDLVARGGMADVYRAHDQLLDRDVAVKMFRPEALEESQDLRAQEEARLASSLSHPGLVAVHDARLNEGIFGTNFMVMELLEGPTLSDQLRKTGKLPPRQVAGIGRQIAAALAYVHSERLIHRDVKPGNIMLAGEVEDDADAPVAKLGDFGIARLIDATRLTLTGTTLGTAPYMSPEQVQGEDVGPPSDVYSLGLVLLQALTGVVAYPGTPVESAFARVHRDPDIPEDLGQEWHQLLGAMTAQDPSYRPTSEQVTDALGSMLAAERLGLDPPTQVLPTLPILPTPQRRGARHGEPTAYPLKQRWNALSLATRIAILAIAAVLVLAVALMLRPTASAPPAERQPAYPSVPGQLGEDLTQLQKAVEP